jgi:hypothetical protein
VVARSAEAEPGRRLLVCFIRVMIRIAAILVGISGRRGHARPHVGRRARIAAALFLIGLPALVGADLRDGQAAYDRGDYTTAFAEFTRAAEQGNLEAQYRLGQMYRKGLGVVRNDDLAFHWIRSSAEQGFSVAEVATAWPGITCKPTSGSTWPRSR